MITNRAFFPRGGEIPPEEDGGDEAESEPEEDDEDEGENEDDDEEDEALRDEREFSEEVNGAPGPEAARGSP